jgi:uncharacterized protein YkwD
MPGSGRDPRFALALTTALAACAGQVPAETGAGEPASPTAVAVSPAAPRNEVMAPRPAPKREPAPEKAAEPAPPAEPPLKPGHAGAKAYASEAQKQDQATLKADRLRAGILKDAIKLAKRAKQRPPRADARLDKAMNDLAHNLRDDDLPALEVVDFLLTHYGIVEPSPHLLLSRGTAGADREIRQQTTKEIAEVYKAGPVDRIGVGIDRAGDLMYVVVGLQEKHLTLAPLPRKLARGTTVAVKGKLVGRYRSARVVITAPDGRVSEQEVSARAGSVEGQLACAADGRYQVEVTAEDKSGTAVLANFPVFCGVDPPALAPRSAGTRQRRVTAEAAEKDVLALVNRDRAAAKLPPVEWDEKLAEVARAHSRDMAEHDFVGHVSPRTGTALDRVRKAGLEPGIVLENVGRAYSAAEAEAGFMASPGHRANVVEPKAKRMGVGVVLGKPVTGTIPLYVTQVLTN